MKQILITAFIILYTLTLNAINIPEEVKYNIKVNKEFKGILYFNNSGLVNYYNITPRDKIPFYAPRKKFTLQNLEDGKTLKNLEVGNEKHRIVYDLSKLSPDEIDEADISQEDISQSAIIYNDEDLPTEVLEKREIHTVESLMLSIFETKKLPREEFYLYEPHKNMLVKVVFHKEGSEKLTINEKVCSADTYVLEIAGRGKRLIRVYTNGYPLQVESFSKKWSFILSGAGKPKKVSFKNSDIVFASLKRDIKKEYGAYNLKIISQDIENDVFKKKYTTSFHISKELNTKILQQYLIKYTRNNRYMKYANKEDSYVFSIDKDDVLNLAKKKYDFKDNTHYWKKSTKSFKVQSLLSMAANKRRCKLIPFSDKEIECNGKKKSVNFEKIIEEYYKNTRKKVKISDIKIKESKYEKKVVYDLKTLKNTNPNFLHTFALKLLQDKYRENEFAANVILEESKNKWSVYISKRTVRADACSRLISGVNSYYKDGECQADEEKSYRDDKIQTIVRKYIQNVYKDLFILDVPVEYGEDRVSFEYLELMKDVTDACE